VLHHTDGHMRRTKVLENEVVKEITTAKFTYAELEEEETHLRKRQGWSEKLYKLDFYGAPLAAEAAERLRGAAGQLRQTDFRSSR
jgi:hypothetical protein